MSAPSAQPVGQQRAQAAPRPPNQPCLALSPCARVCCRLPAARAPTCRACAPAPSAPACCTPVQSSCRARSACLPRARLPRVPRAPQRLSAPVACAPQCPACTCLSAPRAQPRTQRLSPAPGRDTAACLATQVVLFPATILEVVLRYNLASCIPSIHNTVQCIAIHCSLLPSFSIAIHYTMLQYTFQPNYNPCHNRIFVLQYNSTAI